MSYATPADMLIRYDARRLGDLVKDDGTRAKPVDLPADPNLQAALDDGAGLIDAACLAGGRYLPSDLTGLIGLFQEFGGHYQDANFLIRLNCDLAYGYLVARRGFSHAETQNQSPGFAEALATLGRLREGELVFNIDAAIDAGKPHGATLSSNIALISSTTRVFGQLDVDPSRHTPFD